jgi:hypothetical protein
LYCTAEAIKTSLFSVLTIQQSGTPNLDFLFTEIAFGSLEWQECAREAVETISKRKRNVSITIFVFKILLTKFCYGDVTICSLIAFADDS